MSEGYVGEVRLFAGDFAPRDWALCDGRLLPIAQNAALFAVLGTTYGGDGRQTFALPDLRARMPIGRGRGPGLAEVQLGERLGEAEVTLTANQMPLHTHAVGVSGAAAVDTDPTGKALAAAPNETWSAAAVDGVMAATSVGRVGGDRPHQNLQPFLVVQYVICLQGIFPARG